MQNNYAQIEFIFAASIYETNFYPDYISIRHTPRTGTNKMAA